MEMQKIQINVHLYDNHHVTIFNLDQDEVILGANVQQYRNNFIVIMMKSEPFGQ